MKKLIMVLSMVLTGCATEHKIQKLDLVLEAKGQVGEKTLGINSSNELIMQEEKRADMALATELNVHVKLEKALEDEGSDLKRCRMDMADPSSLPLSFKACAKAKSWSWETASITTVLYLFSFDWRNQ